MSTRRIRSFEDLDAKFLAANPSQSRRRNLSGDANCFAPWRACAEVFIAVSSEKVTGTDRPSMSGVRAASRTGTSDGIGAAFNKVLA
jgi:hypothetical protein